MVRDRTCRHGSSPVVAKEIKLVQLNATGIFGKWHVPQIGGGREKGETTSWFPNRRGT
jgi:hypothetical protein